MLHGWGVEMNVWVLINRVDMAMRPSQRDLSAVNES